MGDDYYLQPPRQQKFYRVLCFVCTINGLAKFHWWEMDDKYKLLMSICAIVPRVVGLVYWILMTIFIFFYYNELSFASLGIVFSIYPVGTVVNMKQISALFKSYEKLMKDFMDKIHIYSYYIKENDEYIKKMLIKIEKCTRMTTYYLVFLIGIDWCSWVITPIINNYTKKELIYNRTMRLQTCIYVWMPFDYAYDYTGWAFIHMFNSYVCGAACTIVAVFDSLMFAFVFHMIGHIVLLKRMLRTSFVDKDMNDIETKNILIEIIKYHTFIVKTFNDMQSAFGLNVTANYLQNLFEDSLLLFQMMFGDKADKVLFGLMLLVYMGELIFMSFVLEEVRRQTDNFSDLLYSIPWEDMSLSNQKTFKIFLTNIQNNLSFKAAGGLEAGVRPMTSILKSTFSYYIMLKSSIAK